MGGGGGFFQIIKLIFYFTPLTKTEQEMGYVSSYLIQMYPNNIEGKITDIWLAKTEGIFR